MGTLQALLSRLDPDPVVRGRQFEHICKWFLETDPIYAPQLKRVWLWKDWPGRWGADAGIDLVAQTKDGKLWGIQAKAYAPHYRIKKSDVDTFLSESSREVFSYRLLITTTNHVGATALRTLEAQEKPAHLSLLGDLERAAVEWPTAPNRLVGRAAEPRKPRPHQKRAIREVVAGLEKHDRGQLIMACGTGKTLVALWLAEAMEAQRTLILVPSLSLLAQTLREWRANAIRPFEALPVCSDETVRGEDLLVAHTNDLPFPVTTDADEIATFLRKRGPRVVFSTYQSSPKIAEAFAGGRVPGFDLAIADEAHRVAGSVAKDFGTILDARAIPAVRRLFMTATPRYVKSWVRKQAEEADLDVASMDDVEKFGPVLHRLTFGEAIDRDLLSDYQVAVVAVDDETIREYVERGTFVTFGDGVVDARTLAAQIGLAKAMRKWDLRRTVSFHSRVDWARRFADSIREVVEWMPARQRPTGFLWGDHVSGGMSSGERDVRLNRLREVGTHERGLLSNARCLAEGVDVPTLDGVAFIDPRRSEVDVVQAVGRAIRKAQDKTIGTVVLPVFVGRGEDAEAKIKTSAFAHVWQVLNALRSHDEALAEELDALRRELGRKGTLAKRPGKIHLLVPTDIDPGFVGAFDARLVERTTGSWHFWMGLLERYAKQYGSIASVVRQEEYEGFPIGSWLTTRRLDRRRGRLDDDRIGALDELGMVWEPYEREWEEGLALCRAWVKERGSLATVKQSDVFQGFRIGRWVGHRVEEHRSGRLPDERAKALVELGLVWDPRELKWMEGLSICRDWVEERGPLGSITGGTVYEGFPIGRWLHQRRTQWRRGTLSQSQVTALTELGLVWDPVDSGWKEGIDIARAWAAENGTLASVTRATVYDGFPLGKWMKERRVYRRRGTLSTERVAALDALGMVWDSRWHEERLEEGIEVAKAWAVEHGSLASVDKPTVYEGFPLGTWLTSRRVAHRKGRLAQTHVAALDQLGMIWNPADADWEKGIQAARGWAAEHGSLASVTISKFYQGFPLGKWVNKRRHERRTGRLAQDRIEALDRLGLDWHPPLGPRQKVKAKADVPSDAASRKARAKT